MIRQDIEETMLYSFNYVVCRVRGAISTCAASARGGQCPWNRSSRRYEPPDMTLGTDPESLKRQQVSLTSEPSLRSKSSDLENIREG